MSQRMPVMQRKVSVIAGADFRKVGDELARSDSERKPRSDETTPERSESMDRVIVTDPPPRAGLVLRTCGRTGDMDGQIPMTPEGNARLKEELKNLKEVEQHKISREIGVAREH